ncbi:DUF3558 domain-containing protein [Streptomyces natalensis]|uniref:DUF3558 domain-containing protein n=1 Tax=Streptomyces natalensis ATCC 27448 TaxID=1240678 RepID=A0A0D7CAL6_9ACTN|nr:DUF3558 domain-containing protein [Streptomyces natalensis]KIZ13288.1 hypothetical protein SNA_38160 [Streptomyces natalensis ATCC 27448]
MHRSAKRLASLLACAAVPVMLVAGCSGSDSNGSDGSSDAPSTSAKPSATVAAAKYKKLPNPCEAFSKDTLGKLVPKTKNKGGEPGTSDDATSHGTCSWDSSDENGVDGTQFRWLDVGFQRYDSDANPAVGTGEKRAADFYAKQVANAKGTEGAKKVQTAKTDGAGDESTAITYDIKKDKTPFKNTTIVARAANIVVTVNYNGAGMAGADTPKAAKLLKSAQAAAKEAVAAAVKANG